MKQPSHIFAVVVMQLRCRGWEVRACRLRMCRFICLALYLIILETKQKMTSAVTYRTHKEAAQQSKYLKL